MTQLPLCFTASTPAVTRRAARPRAREAKRQRELLWAVFQMGNYTADEAGALCGLSPLSARPRVSELARLYGLIEPTGVRRPTAGGALAAEWRVRA